VKKLIIIIALLCGACAAQTCPPGQEDLLDFVVPSQSLQNGHFDVLYPSSGTFYWVKSNKGYPWDVDLFDENFIYQSRTELGWNDPATFKQFNTAIKWMPRCVDASKLGKLSTIALSPAETAYSQFRQCAATTKQNLSYAINEIWNDGLQSFGGNLPANQPTLLLSYRYAYDSLYKVCKAKETYSFQKGIGLTQWTLYSWTGSSYVQQNRTNDVSLKPGAIQPYHPCWP